MSSAEVRLHRLLRSAGIEGWTAGAVVTDQRGRIGVVDILFRAQRLVVEVDGLRAHAGEEAFVADRRRQNRLVAAGYTVLRITWNDLVDRPTEVVRLIVQVLGRAA